MRIVHSAPLECAKAGLCRGDEALVSRLGNGLVERLQESGGRGSGRKFLVSCGGGPATDLSIGENCPEYHIIKFLSLVLAGSAFPGHFPMMEELRLSRRAGLLVAASYSGFVPDSTGVIGRRSDAMEKYYSSDERGEMDTVREEADRFERSANPELPPLLARLSDSGLVINHPEANYHVHEGKTVFFEIDGISMPQAARALRDPGCISLLAEIHAVAFISLLKNIERNYGKEWERFLVAGYTGAGFGGLFNFFRHVMRVDDTLGRRMLGQGQDIWKFHILSWLKVMESTGRGGCPLDGKEPPVPIDQELLFPEPSP